MPSNQPAAGNLSGNVAKYVLVEERRRKREEWEMGRRRKPKIGSSVRCWRSGGGVAETYPTDVW